MIAGCTGAVLAGGAGKRLGGVRKAFLRFADGTTLIERTLRVMEIFSETLIVANEREPYEKLAPVVSDVIRDRGAPGGLHAALSAAKAEWVFLCACDMPALDVRVIEALADRRGDALACAPLVDGWPEPLCSFWSRAALLVIERRLRESEPSFKDLLAEVPSVLVPVEELPRGALESFANVNTEADLAAWSIFRG